MGLPWVRLDANIGTHDKVLELAAQRDGSKAFMLYICALGWAAAHGTDGLVPFSALPIVHGSRKLGDLLVSVRMWEPDPKGWKIHNWADRQELEIVTEGKRAMKKASAEKGNCVRWHAPECWKAGVGCSR
jgi:hypothetical protein